MNKTIRIGTRDSELALWQAQTVSDQLQKMGLKTELVPIKSDGDIILNKPLYELGITGVFTKTLDCAMLSGSIDIAVHSFKDVPTILPQGIVQAAVLPRANASDLLIYKNNTHFLDENGIVATGSLRRTAMWLNRYPTHQVVDLRGNINTRLQKLENSSWNGAIFAAAGLERIQLKPQNTLSLDWMTPAPAQGAMVVVALANDPEVLEAVSALNHLETEITTYIERQFLRTLEGGCSAPIGAFAQYFEEEDMLHFTGVLLSLDGKQKIETTKKAPIQEWKKLGYFAAHEILEKGGQNIMTELRTQK